MVYDRNPFYICVLLLKQSESGGWERAIGRSLRIIYNFDELYELIYNALIAIV